MRIEYDRIQQRMKDQLKQPTPFERIKKFFGKNKSKRNKCCFFIGVNYFLLFNLNKISVVLITLCFVF